VFSDFEEISRVCGFFFLALNNTITVSSELNSLCQILSSQLRKSDRVSTDTHHAY
jgi:hypothetical protein